MSHTHTERHSLTSSRKKVKLRRSQWKRKGKYIISQSEIRNSILIGCYHRATYAQMYTSTMSQRHIMRDGEEIISRQGFYFHCLIRAHTHTQR